MAEGNGQIPGSSMIEFDEAKLSRLVKAYNALPKDSTPATIFEFEGIEYVKGYAKYLIEYLSLQFKQKKN